MMEYRVQVWWTETRPIVPDEFTAVVVVAAEDTTDAQLCALQIAMCHDGVEMVTRSLVLGQRKLVEESGVHDAS
jgi:hypothetical protein